jgi:aminomethyltransferase
MVDFAGYDMPLHYGSQIEEHHAVRRDAGMFDVSHMRAVDLTGAGAREFLGVALANDVARLAAPGKALYTCLLSDSGGVLDDLIVYWRGDERFRLVVNAATADKDVAWLRRLLAQRAAPPALTVRDDLALIAVQGPRARERTFAALPEIAGVATDLKPFNGVSVPTAHGEFFVGRTGYTGEDGFELMVPAAVAPAVWQALATAGVRPCGLGARDTLRLEAGLNLYGQDMDDSITPLESGLGWTVDRSTDRQFVGRAALDAQVASRNLFGLLLTEGGGVLRAHQAVDTAHGRGEITSGSFAPTLGRSIALARLPAAVQPGDDVTVEVRSKPLSARVVRPPFVRHGKSLVG